MKSYQQYCGLAKALDHIGDRWTLLIVRELLISHRRYSEIRAALPGIATNLLADRLRQLEADAVIEKQPDGAYGLTDFGRELEPVIEGLVRWGGRWMTERAIEDSFRPDWLVVALRALLPTRRKGRIQLEVDSGLVYIDHGTIGVGRLRSPEAIVTGSPNAVLGVVAGLLPLEELGIEGDAGAAAEVLLDASPT